MTDALSYGSATLPMYDWPEVRGATDALWAALREALRAAGVAAPAALDRDRAAERLWTDPRLVLGQTCGLPFVRGLAARVTLLGAPDFGLPDCPAGHYDSVVVVRAEDPRETLAGFRGGRLALNGPDSQSGYAALWHHAAPLARDGGFFGTAVRTGSHAAAAACVAAGGADLAALDHVSWRLLRAHRPEAARLRVLMRTDPTPGLPYIAARGTDPNRHRGAITAAIGGLDAASRGALGLRGFQRFEPEDYAVILRRAAAAEAGLRLPPLEQAAAHGAAHGSAHA